MCSASPRTWCWSSGFARGARASLSIRNRPPSRARRLSSQTRSPPAEQLLDTQSLLRAVDSLPARCRTALILQRRDGLTYAQIGQKLGVSPDMVKKYLASAIARCRLALGEEP
ncbi:MAG: sigma-70 family RNA polymerase sigma factor [Gammaproteobacteria bacterium]